MDITLRLRLALDRVKTEHLRRAEADSREDLLQELDRLRSEATRVRIPAFTVAALSRAAEILLDINRPIDALRVLDDARHELGEQDPQGRGVDLLGKQARAYAQLHDWTATSAVCEQGIEIIERFRKKVTPLGLQSAYLRFRIELYQLGVRAALMLDDCDLALERAELAKCVTSRRIGSRKKRNRGQLADARSKYRSLCEKLDTPGLTEEARGQLAAKRRAQWDIMSIGRFRDEGRLDNTTTATAVKRVLSESEAILYYFWLSQRELAVFLVTNTEIHAELKELSDQERACIDQIPTTILNFRPECGGLLEPTCEHTSALLSPQIISAMKGKRSLLISPHRNLHLVPFHALPVEGEYLIDRFSVTYLPNLSPLFVCYAPAKNPRLFALGVPATAVKLGSRKVAPIPNAEEEITKISMTYAAKGCESRAVVGPEATEGLLRSMDEMDDMAKYDHLHFACHGTTVDSESPLESSLILYDSELDGLDIAGFELDVDLAVLSACCSGQRPYYTPGMSGSAHREELPGDELFGLQAAFFAAGVRQLISTLWPVDSAPACQITHALHEGVLCGMLPDEALQHAMIEFKRNASLFYRSVDKWAPFFLVSLAKPQRTIQED